MSSQGWKILYSTIRSQARRLPRPRRRFEYSDALIAALFFWAVWNDRPLCWATQRTSYNGRFRPRRRPSDSEFNRRVRSDRFALLLSRIFDALTPPRAAEPDVALALVSAAAPADTLLTDGVNDSARLYEAAEARGVSFRARPRRNAAQGHRRQSAARWRGIADWQAHGTDYPRERGAAERVFGWQSSFGGGPAPLPAWVRTPPRVFRWVAAKLTIYHVRRSEKCHAA